MRESNCFVNTYLISVEKSEKDFHLHLQFYAGL